MGAVGLIRSALANALAQATRRGPDSGSLLPPFSSFLFLFSMFGFACVLVLLSRGSLGRRPWLLCLLALAGHGPLAAQTPAAPAAARYRYWEAPPDSLRQVLAVQRADTARLRTLLHLLDRATPKPAEQREAQELASRLGRPEAPALRWLPRPWSVTQTYPALLTGQRRDSLKAVITAFDRLGRPVPRPLFTLMAAYVSLNQQEEAYRYFQARRRFYQAQGATENLAVCELNLARYYTLRGDNNQAISHYQRTAELYRGFDRRSYYSRLMGTGARYAEWGNPAKALPYLQQALRAPRRWGLRTFIYHTIAQLRLRQHDYPAALQAVNQSLSLPTSEPGFGAERPYETPQGLTLKSAVLLALGRPAEARPLLQKAQQLADSLRLPLVGSGIPLELDATWARYYAATGVAARAETFWRVALHKALAGGSEPLRLKYLRGLAEFYQDQRQFAPATRYYQAATALADTLETAQGALHVASYEYERAERAQTLRIARLREAQLLDAARARRQRYVLGATLAGLALLAGLGFVLWRSNRRQQLANAQLSRQKAEIQQQRDQTTQALATLQTTQKQLIQAEKMASLGELTAGIAHEIQNPLNFVNNFSEVSVELVGELKEAQAAGDAEEVVALADDLAQNLGKIHQHGQRAAGIVRGMLEHSRASTGERAPTDLNALCDEYLRLSYHGLRANDKSFNAALTTDFAPGLPLVSAVSGDLGRVLLNLFSNAFYAVQKRQQTGEAGYAPTVSVGTRRVGDQVEIRVRDNGTGMPAEVQAKIFQPFFTTKPTGEGTGLGLSLAHDIVAQGHGGALTVESQPGQGTTFLITLPA